MNKKLIIVVVAAIVAVSAAIYICSICRNSTDELVSTNVEALSRTEGGFVWHCMEIANDCYFICSGCGSRNYAIGHMGPSYGIGPCEFCGRIM